MPIIVITDDNGRQRSFGSAPKRRTRPKARAKRTFKRKKKRGLRLNID